MGLTSSKPPIDNTLVINQVQNTIQDCGNDPKKAHQLKLAQKVLDFAQGKISRYSMSQGIVSYLDTMSAHRFSRAVEQIEDGKSNSTAMSFYCEYKTSVQELLKNLKNPPENFIFSKSVNEISEIVMDGADSYHGVGLIRAHEDAHFLGSSRRWTH